MEDIKIIEALISNNGVSQTSFIKALHTRMKILTGADIYSMESYIYAASGTSEIGRRHAFISEIKGDNTKSFSFVYADMFSIHGSTILFFEQKYLNNTYPFRGLYELSIKVLKIKLCIISFKAAIKNISPYGLELAVNDYPVDIQDKGAFYSTEGLYTLSKNSNNKMASIVLEGIYDDKPK